MSQTECQAAAGKL